MTDYTCFAGGISSPTPASQRRRRTSPPGEVRRWRHAVSRGQTSMVGFGKSMSGGGAMSRLEVHQYRARSDNYGVLIHDPKTGATAAVDAPDAEELLAALHEKGWTLSHILTTHHHHDHTAGNTIVKRMTGCAIVGPAKEASSIPDIDVAVKEGDAVAIGNAKARVIETPGHTKGHVSYHFPHDDLVFVGDTLFSVGCGKLLEGDAKTMWSSLKKLADLPPQTNLYCGHEYTNNNCR